MNPKRALRDLEKQLRRQPGSLVVRIRLAAVLHALGRLPEAVDLYRSVAMAYFAQGRLDQAMAVCHSLLEIAPMHQDTHLLLAELDSHRARRVVTGEEIPEDALGVAGGAGWQAPLDGEVRPGSEADANGAAVPRRQTGPQIRRDTGQAAPRRDTGRETGSMSRRETGPAVWRESGPFGRRDTPDPRAAFGAGPGNGPSARPPSEDSRRVGSVTSRLPLPVVRTFTGLVPPPPGSRGREGSGATPVTSRLRRSSDSLQMPEFRPARSSSAPPPHGQRPDADEDAPTQLADKWLHPLAPGNGAAAPTRAPLRARSSSASELHTAPRGAGSVRLPAFQARPRRKLVGSGADGAAGPGEPAEPTEYDDGMELARAFGRGYGMSEESALEAPGKLPLLSGLSERSVEAIAAGMVRKRITSGEMIVRDGEAGDSCFVLAHGEARVLKRDPLLPRGDLVEVSRLSDGDLFGEVAMLSDQRRHASVQAVSDCDLLEIPRGHLIQVGRRFPEVDSFLQQFYRERLIATLVSTASFFRPLDVPQRTSLLSHFRFSHVEPGARIVGEGERAGGFFLIVLGAVEITKRVSERRQVLLATLGEGTYFGEMSLLRGEVARASVTATGPAELAVLPAKNFYALVANHPVLWDQVRQEAHRRELEMVQIVTGVTGAV
ncbi:MAG TPA: cyclic nucleotide-binding domain-containing protein [Kofleriaceae bacterium]|nr:cyclic nucleotide-binding domain-containing protein [Kofleriaceae bacterium]